MTQWLNKNICVKWDSLFFDGYCFTLWRNIRETQDKPFMVTLNGLVLLKWVFSTLVWLRHKRILRIDLLLPNVSCTHYQSSSRKWHYSVSWFNVLYTALFILLFFFLPNWNVLCSHAWYVSTGGPPCLLLITRDVPLMFLFLVTPKYIKLILFI